MALPVVARPGVIAAARLTGEWPALSRLVSQPVIQRSRVSLTVQEKRISSSLNREQGSFIAMKSRSRKRTPNIVNLTVKRRYLTEREIERLMDRARKHGRYGHRDATMILVAYRHGLRASEVCDLQWQQIELSEGRLHVHRVKSGIPSVHPIRGDEMRALRKLVVITPKTPTYSFPSAAGLSAPSVSTASSSASARPPRCHSRSTHTCFAMPAGSSSPTTATTRGPCSTTSGTRTFSIRSGTPKWRPTASRTFGGTNSRRDRAAYIVRSRARW